MTLPRDPDRDLSLERLDSRDGSRRAHYGEAAQVRLLESAGRTGDFAATYQALVDAVFSAPGAAEWLNGVWQRVTAILDRLEKVRPPAVARDAIRAADPDPRRY